jgi:hypothetical protein
MREDDMFDDIEDMFGAKKQTDKKKLDGDKPKKKTERSLLDANVSKNLAIAISRLWKGDWDDFAELVQALDTKKITPEGVETLAKVLPTAGEMKTQLNDKGDRSNMNKADTFVLAMAKVNEDKRLRQRVDAMLFQIQFDEILKPLDQSITRIQQACTQVQESDSFPQLLGIILVVGNKLNQNQKNQESSAIRLKDLSKLAQTKSNKGETVLEYIVKNILKKKPHLLKVSSELSAVTKAGKVNIDIARSDKKKLVDGLKNLERQFEKDEDAGDDYFEASLGPFKDKATIYIDSLENKFDATMESFADVGTFLLEPQLNPEDVSDFHLSYFVVACVLVWIVFCVCVSCTALTDCFPFFSLPSPSSVYLQLFTMLDKFLKLLDATTKKVSEKQARLEKMAKAKAAKAARATAKEEAAAGR